MPDEPQPPPQQSDIADTLVSGGRVRPSLHRGQAVGRYLVLSFLGEGGMGTVYAAYDPDLDRKVALKLLKVGGEDRETARARLMREAQAMARVSHPNVLAVFEAGPFGEELFLAMELVDGVTLDDWLREQPRERDEILAAFVAAGEGLAAAHGAGLVHRDFKPANVLVGRDGRVRVTDFGLAHVEAREVPVPVPPGASAGGATPLGSGPTLAGTIAGTPAYMSPEQLAGAPSDARTDQFSFCVALWEALCAERPFGGSNLEEIRAKVLLGSAPVPPRSLPGSVRTALSRGLARRPQDRFAGMGELLPLLRRRPRGRMLRLGLAAALLGVAGGAASLAGWWRHQEATRCTRETSAATERIWGAQRHAQLRATLAKAGLTDELVGAAVGAMDAAIARLADEKRRVCEAGRATGVDDGRARSCLQRREQRAETALRLLLDEAVDVRNYLGVALDRIGQPLGCLERSARAAPIEQETLLRLQAMAERFYLLEDMGHAGQVAKEAPAAIEAAKRAGARGLLAALESSYARSLWSLAGPTDEVVDLLLQAVHDADASGDDEASLTSRLRLVNVQVVGRGKPQEALPWMASVRDWLARLGNPPLGEIDVLVAEAALQAALDRGDEAVATYRRCLALAEKVYGSATAMVAAVHNDLGTELMRQGKVRESLVEFRAAAASYRAARFASASDESVAFANVALALLYLGDARGALAEFQRAREALRPLEDQTPTYLEWVDVMAAGAHEELGERDRAEQAITRALASRETMDVGTLMEALHTKAKVLLARGRPAEALSYAREAAELSESNGETMYAAMVRFTEARALWDSKGDRAQALALARAARQRLAGTDHALLRGRIDEWLAKVADVQLSR